MSKVENTDQDSVLDSETVQMLGRSLTSDNVPLQPLAPLRERVMQRVDAASAVSSLFHTIRADEGSWIKVAPLVEKKVLNINHEAGTESYLLRLHPGAAPGSHHHYSDELCVVLEGDVSFDDVHLQAGDYHFARKGSTHGIASTSQGALIFLQSGLAAA